MSKTPPQPENESLRAELARLQPPELRALDIEIGELRAQRGLLTAKLHPLEREAYLAGAQQLSPEAKKLAADIGALEADIDARRQKRDDLRLNSVAQLQAIVAPYLAAEAPALIEAARLIQQTAGVLAEVDRFMNANSPPWAAGAYANSLPAPARLIALAESLAQAEKPEK